MRNNNNPPKWASNLVESVSDRYRLDEIPRLFWTKTYDWKLTRGDAYYIDNEISISAGYDRKYQKLVVLHELSHIIVREGHTSNFWDTAIKLYKRHRYSNQYIIYYEGSYRVGARKALSRWKLT